MCVCVHVCVRGGIACLCDRNGATEQGVSPLVCEAHRMSTGLGVMPLHVTRSEIIVHLLAFLAPLPHPLGSPLLVALSAQHWAL